MSAIFYKLPRLFLLGSLATLATYYEKLIDIPAGFLVRLSAAEGANILRLKSPDINMTKELPKASEVNFGNVGEAAAEAGMGICQAAEAISGNPLGSFKLKDLELVGKITPQSIEKFDLAANIAGTERSAEFILTCKSFLADPNGLLEVTKFNGDLAAPTVGTVLAVSVGAYFFLQVFHVLKNVYEGTMQRPLTVLKAAFALALIGGVVFFDRAAPYVSTGLVNMADILPQKMTFGQTVIEHPDYQLAAVFSALGHAVDWLPDTFKEASKLLLALTVGGMFMPRTDASQTRHWQP